MFAGPFRIFSIALYYFLKKSISITRLKNVVKSQYNPMGDAIEINRDKFSTSIRSWALQKEQKNRDGICLWRLQLRVGWKKLIRSLGAVWVNYGN